MKYHCEICGEKDKEKLMARTSFIEGEIQNNKILCLECLWHELKKEND